MNTLHVKKNDIVIVLSGKDVGAKGKVLETFPKEGKVLVEGVNVHTKHRKPRRQNDPGGLIEQECPIYACKVIRLCTKCDKTTRLAHQILEDGTKVRKCKHCGDTV